MENQIQINEVINELNQDISFEYAQAVQYIQHANMLLGAPYYALVDELIEHGNESFEHAKILSEIVHFTGGVPTIEVAPRYTSKDNIEMLKQDLMYEYQVFRRYITRIKQLESLGMYDSAERIRNIMVEEQEHINELEIALGVDRSIKESDIIYK